MNLSLNASVHPEKKAIIIAETGESISYSELNQWTLDCAHWMWRRGLRFGDHIAVAMDNVPEFLTVCFAALRSGIYLTPVSVHLAADEAAYIVNDCGAKILFVSPTLQDRADLIQKHLDPGIQPVLVDEETFCNAAALDASTNHEIAECFEELQGSLMFYSSGTTGKPKGILHALDKAPVSNEPDSFMLLMQGLYGFTSESVYLHPAPLYHGAPLRWIVSLLRIGGTLVLMKTFDAAKVLKNIECYQVTHAQFVPTMFVRMLQLGTHLQQSYSHQSLKVVLHAAAPCAVDVKQAMLNWWGPIIHEYYSGSEGCGLVCVGPEEWLRKPGTVGKPLIGVVHIVGQNGMALPAGEVGTVYFEGPSKFEYHGDKTKTAEAYNDKGWNTMGDMGYLDADGYLFLTDRLTNMIISGGVNIYPQESENVLTLHPKVQDVAVIGIPNAEYGEEVKAVVQLKSPDTASREVEQELLDYCLQRLSKYKCPRSIDFVSELPRHPTGKLLKRLLRERYWPANDSRKI